MREKRILDHGYVELVSCSGSDTLIADTARISYKGKLRRDVGELLKFLARHKHTTPFEHAFITFKVKAPIFVFRQWHRHRTQSFCELSGRHVELPPECYIPPELSNSSSAKTVVKTAFEAYSKLLELGVRRELARIILPLGTYSEMYASANLWNWIRFLKLRLHKTAQREIRQYAEAIWSMLAEVYPESLKAWEYFLKEEP